MELIRRTDPKIDEASLRSRNCFVRLLFQLMVASFVFDRLRIYPEMTMSLQRPLYIAIFCAMMLLVLTKRNLRVIPSSSILFALLTFDVMLVLSIPFALDFSISAVATLSLVQLSLAGVIVGIFLHNFGNAEDISLLAKTLCWITIMCSLTIITDYIGLTNFVEWYVPDWAFVRHMGILGEPNFAAGKLAIGFPFVIWVPLQSVTARKTLSTIIYATGCGLVIIGIFLTGSRMGISMCALLILSVILICNFKGKSTLY